MTSTLRMLNTKCIVNGIFQAQMSGVNVSLTTAATTHAIFVYCTTGCVKGHVCDKQVQIVHHMVSVVG